MPDRDRGRSTGRGRRGRCCRKAIIAQVSTSSGPPLLLPGSHRASVTTRIGSVRGRYRGWLGT